MSWKELTFSTDFTQSVDYTHSFIASHLINCLCWKWLIMNPRVFNCIQSFTVVSGISYVLHPDKSMFRINDVLSWQIECISLVQEDFLWKYSFLSSQVLFYSAGFCYVERLLHVHLWKSEHVRYLVTRPLLLFRTRNGVTSYPNHSKTLCPHI